MIAFLGIFAVFLIIGIPISLALGAGGLLYLYLTGNGMLVMALPQRMLQGVACESTSRHPEEVTSCPTHSRSA